MLNSTLTNYIITFHYIPNLYYNKYSITSLRYYLQRLKFWHFVFHYHSFTFLLQYLSLRHYLPVLFLFHHLFLFIIIGFVSFPSSSFSSSSPVSSSISSIVVLISSLPTSNLSSSISTASLLSSCFSNLFVDTLMNQFS